MIEQIIHRCFTGFGDCVIGFVSTYIFRHFVQIQLHTTIPILIDWVYVRCPYITFQHQLKKQLRRHQTTTINCLFSGSDGTGAFSGYYLSSRMNHDIHCPNKKNLVLITNQYLGKCFIRNETTREQIKQLTYDAYQYLWTQLLDQQQINTLGNLTSDWDHTLVIYIRLGDQFLSQPQMTIPTDHITMYYQYLSSVFHLEDYQKIFLLGDIEHQKLTDIFVNIYPSMQTKVNVVHGDLAHSVTQRNDTIFWHKIMSDLQIIRQAHDVCILSLGSNFPRIVMFLKPVNHRIFVLDETSEQQIHIKQITDPSTLFAKHYLF